MRNKEKETFEGPRSEKLANKRKMNRVLNLLIGIVVILICFFGSQLIFSNEGGHEQTVGTKEQAGTEKHKKQDDKNNNQTKEENSNSEENKEIVTEGDPGSNIIKTVENPTWKPVGTSQTEPHTTVYEQSSVDWKEMTQAISLAIGLNESDFTIWWLGRNGDAGSVATIKSKDGQHIYKVQIEWVTNEGWKPVKYEELRSVER